MNRLLLVCYILCSCCSYAVNTEELSGFYQEKLADDLLVRMVQVSSPNFDRTKANVEKWTSLADEGFKELSKIIDNVHNTLPLDE